MELGCAFLVTAGPGWEQPTLMAQLMDAVSAFFPLMPIDFVCGETMAPRTLIGGRNTRAHRQAPKTACP